MTRHKHDIEQYLKWMNEGKSYDDMAKIMGVPHKATIHKWIKNNYIIEKKTVYTAKKKQ
jgi:hypothetical protein